MKRLSLSLFPVAILCLLFASCEKNIPTLGDDVIDAPEVGVYETILLPSDPSEWGNTFDTLGGRHRYVDSLTRNGAKQKQLIVGSWGDEKSIVYLTSYDTTDGNKLTDKSYRQMLLNAYALKDSKGNITYDTQGNIIVDTTIDLVTTTLKFSVDTTKTFSPFPTTGSPSYSLQLYTGREVADSAQYNLDTLTRTLLHQATMQKRAASFSMPIHSFNIAFKTGDTLLLQENSVTYTSPRTRVIIKDSVYYTSSNTKDSTTVILSNTADTLRDTTMYDTLINWTTFLNLTRYDSTYIDSTILQSTDSLREVTHRLFGYLEDSATSLMVVKDTINHYQITHYAKDSHITTIKDSTVYPLDTLHARVTISSTESKTFPKKYNEVKMDTTIYNTSPQRDTMVQSWRTYTTKVRQATNDPLQQLLDSLNDTLNLYLSLYNPSGKEQFVHFQDPKIEIKAMRIDTTIKNGDTTITTKVDSSAVTFNRSTMTVTSTTPHSDKSLPRMNGGREIFSRIRLIADEMWATVADSGFKFVSFAEIKLPLDTLKSKLPAYAKSKMTIYGIILTPSDSINPETITPGEILRFYGDGTDRRYSFKNTLDLTKDSVTLNVAANLHDILREKKLYLPTSTPPETYLYLWIDGADMGDIYWKPSSEISLTYILQQAN